MWEDSVGCPVCHTTDMVFASGPRTSKILLIGEAPGEDEIKYAKPFTGKTGNVLRSEFGYFGMDVNRIRLTNLWRHLENDNDECLKNGATEAIKEAVDRQLIILIGAGTVKYFCHCSVEEWNGLEVKSDYFSAPHIIACVQPATVFHGNMLGEVRFAMKNIADIIEKEGLL